MKTKDRQTYQEIKVKFEDSIHGVYSGVCLQIWRILNYNYYGTYNERLNILE